MSKLWIGNGHLVLPDRVVSGGSVLVEDGKITAIKAAVTAVDPDKAFVIVCDAKEVMGEGFGEISADSL